MRHFLAAIGLLVATPSIATTISYSDFSSTAGLQVNGNAASVRDASGRSVLRLTPASTYQAGSVFTNSRVSLDSTASFSAAFSFDINGYGGAGGGADGFVFTLETTSSSVGGYGGGIGYAGLNHSIGVKFDTYQNSGDLSDNFLGVVENGDINAMAGTATASPFVLKSAKDLYAWVDYNGATNDLQVRLANTNFRPDAALIDYSVNIAGILGSNSAYVGFTSATGGGYENNDLLALNVTNSYKPIGNQVQNVPEPPSWVIWATALAMLGSLFRLRRRRGA